MDEEPTSGDVSADALSGIQNAIMDYTADDSLLVGFVVVAEYMEADGTNTVSVIHSPMPPWHMYGLLTYGREWSEAGHMIPVMGAPIDDDDDDAF